MRWTLALAVLLVAGCGGDEPPLPDPAARELPTAIAVVPPEIPGESQEFREMELPPGQFVRAIPTGNAYDAATGPTYRSLCLNCHAVSQTSFAVDAWTRSVHARCGISCGACHGSHEGTFIAQPSSEQCRSCHARQVEAFLASGHGPERAPGMRCISCHEVHETDRQLARSVTLCIGCHLDSEHVRGYPDSRMGMTFMREGYDENGDLRAPDCIYCHMPLDPIMNETGDFRNDKVTLHDSAITVQKNPRDASRLSDAAIDFLLPLCVTCHSERNARHRLENSDPLLLRWAPVGMTPEILRRPSPEATGNTGEESAP